MLAALPDTPWRHLVTSLGYPVGFLAVILGRQQLFTENTLTPVLPLLAAPGLAIAAKLLRLWTVVLASNLLGTFLFAWVAANTTVFSPEAQAAFTTLGLAAAKGGFGHMVLEGIFSGWIIALMVWMLPAVVEARVG